MFRFVRYKYDFNVFEQKIKMGRAYEVTGAKVHDGITLYALRGTNGWFSSEYFEEVRPIMAISNEFPVVNRKMKCWCFMPSEDGEKNFNGWIGKTVTTDVVREFFRCGYNTFIVFTDDKLYIVQST